jgi:nucleotide-binding universal stress UspA family protein
MFDHILVTTDGSALGNLALPVAADLARKYDSALTLLYVVPPVVMPMGDVVYTYDYPAQHASLLEEADRILTDALKKLDYPNTQVVRLERTDLKIEQAILEEVKGLHTELVVMSTHGRSGLAHLFLGSIAEAVLKKIQVPLLLIQAPDRTSSPPASREAAGPPALTGTL